MACDTNLLSVSRLQPYADSVFEKRERWSEPYPGPDQSAVSVHGFADADVVAGEMKRFVSQSEVDAGLPDGRPSKGLACHHSLACGHWGGEQDTATVLKM